LNSEKRIVKSGKGTKTGARFSSFWRREWDSNPRGREPKRFSRTMGTSYFARN